MTLLGDPWLKPVGHHLSVAETESNLIALSALTVMGNPVLTELNIKFMLIKSEDVKISLYNCAGRKVANIIGKKFGKGNHHLRWPFNDENGNVLPRGVYILKSEIDKKIITNKIVKI